MNHGFPDLIYLVMADFGADGFGSGGDFTETLDDAIDQQAEAETLTGRDARVIRIDLDKGTAIDITRGAILAMQNRLRIRGVAAE